MRLVRPISFTLLIRVCSTESADWHNSSVEVNDGEVVDSCFFFTDTGAPSDEAAGFPNAENCPVDGADASPGCTSAGRRRTLSPLEQTIRSRQYNPKRRAAKQQ